MSETKEVTLKDWSSSRGEWREIGVVRVPVAVSDDALLAVGSYCPALRRLCLRGCADVTPRSLRELRAQLPALTVVGPDEDEAEGARMPASGGGLKRRGGEAPHGYDGPGGDSDDELDTRPLESAKRAKAAAWPLTPAAAR